ncbi:MAG: hypothetical protein ACXVUL_10075 [Solirubrobacteraceae bacterium]
MTSRACAYLLAKDLEAALRRGRLMEVMDIEFQIAEDGEPRELAWLVEAYDALGVPIESRRATAVDVIAAVGNARREGLYLGSVSAVRSQARAERIRHLAVCRWNSEHGLTEPGWRVLPGDPEAEDAV